MNENLNDIRMSYIFVPCTVDPLYTYPSIIPRCERRMWHRYDEFNFSENAVLVAYYCRLTKNKLIFPVAFANVLIKQRAFAQIKMKTISLYSISYIRAIDDIR